MTYAARITALPLPEPYATEAAWFDHDSNCSWSQWHCDQDPMPTKWESGDKPDIVTDVFTAEQMRGFALIIAGEADTELSALRGRVEELEDSLREILCVHANDTRRPKAFYIADKALDAAIAKATGATA